MARRLLAARLAAACLLASLLLGSAGARITLAADCFGLTPTITGSEVSAGTTVGGLISGNGESDTCIGGNGTDYFRSGTQQLSGCETAIGFPWPTRPRAIAHCPLPSL